MITVEKVEDAPTLIEPDRNKYVFTGKTLEIDEHTLHQIKAVRDFGKVKEGELGGFIEDCKNLSQYDCAWVADNAKVFEHASVSGNAYVDGDSYIRERARVFGDARVYDSYICGYVCITDNASVCNTIMSGSEMIFGDAAIYSEKDYATIKGFGIVKRNTTFFKCADGEIRVKCGCFYGTIPEFRARVNGTRDGKIAKEYLMIADLMEYHFDKGDEDED